MSKNERTIKTVLVSRPAVKGYSRWEYRVVECEIGQNGYLNERGVKVLWRSADLYRPKTKSGRGKGPESRAYAERIRQDELNKVMGLVG